MSHGEPSANATSGYLRRFIFFYVAAVMVALQVTFVLYEFVGLDFDPRWMVWLIPFAIPSISAAALTWAGGREKALAEPAAWPSWALGGVLLCGVWAGSYFAVGRMIDPERVRYLPLIVEHYVPFEPGWTLLYALLYPIFVLPFFVVRTRQAFLRLAAADLMMLATCSAAFVALPVAIGRPELPAVAPDFGTWVLSLIRGADPAWNCLPSEHCAAAMVAALATWEADRKVGAFAIVSALLIGLSTLFTKQHYLVDVLAGYAVAFSVHALVRWSRVFEGAPSRQSATRMLER